MIKKIIINVAREESRVAVLENDIVSELYIDRTKEKGLVGNIYKGRVIRVLPGMQAAFVDIGLDKAAFLYVGDICKNEEKDDDAAQESGEPVDNQDDEEVYEYSKSRKPRSTQPIEDLIQPGEELIVQVSKEPIGRKGPRITTYITLPGRFLVYMPTVNHIGVSRRIEDEDEKARLKELIISLDKPEGGYIVRTVSNGSIENDFKADIAFFSVIWKDILKKAETEKAPAFLHSDLALVTRTIRDIFSDDIDKVIIDSRIEHKRILEFAEDYMVELKSRVELYEGTDPIFEATGIEIEISKALSRKVWLKSGGYIVIDYTEALTVIDVNTGRYVGKKNLEDTIFNTNMEAAKEIAVQLRLRNIGGIIIIDFIDMEKEKHKVKVFEVLQGYLANDKAKNNILRISELGLVEMSRERIRGDLTRVLCDPCPYCEASGYLKSPLTVCYEIFREINRKGTTIKDENIIIETHPSVATLLYDEELDSIEELETKLRKKIVIKENPELYPDAYNIR